MPKHKKLSDRFLTRLAEITAVEVAEIDPVSKSSAAIYAAFESTVQRFLEHPHAFPKRSTS
jgi:hypothetical protein